MKNRTQLCIMMLFILCNLMWIDKLNTLLIAAAAILTLFISGIDIYRNFDVAAEYQIMTFDISGMVMSIVLLWHYLVDESFDFLVLHPLQDGTIVSWLVLVTVVDITAYCIYDGRQLLYGTGAAVGSFLLLLQKNIPGLFIVEIVFLVIPYIYKPTRKIVKRSMQMFFVYILVICNMPFLINYTELLENAPSYDIRTCIYIEATFVVFGAVFWYFWTKEKVDEEDDLQLMPRIRELFGKTAVVSMILAAAAVVGLIKGSSLPILESLSVSLDLQTGAFEMAAQAYGAVGLTALAVLFYILAGFLLRHKEVRATRQQKLCRVVTMVYLVQSIFLTQSVTASVAYLVFVVAYMNSVRIAGQSVEDYYDDYEDYADEVDDSDTVLQRGADAGDSAQ